MSTTPTRDFLRDAIRAGRHEDCDRCQWPYTCSTHAAEAVLDACRREDLFILDRSAADQVVEQAKADETKELRARIDEVRALAEAAQPAGGIGCLSRTDSCEGNCGGHRTTGWTLDPAEVLHALDGES